MIHKRSLPDKPGKVLVTFQSPVPARAHSVHLVGDFNDWDQRTHPLTTSHDGTGWCITTELETGRVYQFRYLVNGARWYNDWYADDYVPNPFGGMNSVVYT